MAKESFYTKMKRLGLWDKPIKETTTHAAADIIQIKDANYVGDRLMTEEAAFRAVLPPPINRDATEASDYWTITF